MTEIAELGIRVDSRPAVDGLTKIESKLKSTGVAATHLGNQGATSFDKLKASVFSLQGAMVGFSGFLALRQGFGVISSFEKSMAGVRAVTGATGDTFAALTARARELGAVTSFSASEAAEGMRFLGQAGFEANEVIDSIGPSLKLAQAGMLDLATAADIVSNIMSGFGIAATETASVADVLAISAANANTNIQQMGEAMKFVAPVAAATGQSVEDLAALVGVLGNAGLQSTLAGTGLRMSMLALLNPTKTAQRAIDDLGLTLQELDPDSNNIIEIMKKLADANISAGQASAIFGARAATTVLAIKSQTEALDELLVKTHNADGFLKTTSSIMENTLAGAARRATSALSELALQAGAGGLTGALRGSIDLFTDTISALNGMLDASDKTKTAAFLLADALTLVGIVAASLVASKVVAFFWTLGSAVVTAYTTLATLAAGTTATAGTFSLLTGTVVGATAATSGFTLVLRALTAAMLANPVTALTIAIAAGAVAILSYKSHTKDATAEIKNMTSAVTGLNNAMNPFASLTRTEMITTLAALENQLAGVNQTQDQLRKQFAEGKIDARVFSGLSLTAIDLNKQIAALKSLLAASVPPIKKVEEGVIKLTDAERGLLDTALPLEAATREYEKSVSVLDDLLSRHEITLVQYNTAVQNLNTDLYELTNTTKKVKEAVDPVAEIYKQTANSIQGAFAKTFRSIFDDGIKGFSSLSKNILDVFKDMLAQMATLAIARPIIIPAVSALGGALGLSNEAIGGVTGQLGGAALAGAGAGAGLAAGAGTTGLYAAGGTAAGAAGGFGASVAAAMPWVLGALAVNGLTGGGLFGGKQKQTGGGITLDISGGVISGRAFTDFEKNRSLFRGTKRWTEFTELGKDVNDSLQTALQGTRSAMEEFATTLGTDFTSVVEDFTATFTGKVEDAGVFIATVTEDMLNNLFAQTGAAVNANLDKLAIGDRIAELEAEIQASVERQNSLGFREPGSAREHALRVFAQRELGPLQEKFASMSDTVTELQFVLQNTDFTDMTKALEDVGFAVAVVGRALFEVDTRSDAKKAVDALNDSMHDMIKTGLRLGLTTESLQYIMDSFNKQLRTLATDFDTSISDQILKILDPQAFSLQEFEKIANERLQNAIDLGANILQVERLNALERQKILGDFSTDTIDALRGITDFVSGMGLASYSVLTPAERLAKASGSFESTLASANTGNLNALQALPDVADALLNESRSFYGATEGFQNVFARVEEALGSLVINQADPIILQMKNSDLRAYENAQMIVDALVEMKQEIINLRADNKEVSDTLARVLVA